jgi:glycosyltransferase involved in cell wall biosynthesis
VFCVCKSKKQFGFSKKNLQQIPFSFVSYLCCNNQEAILMKVLFLPRWFPVPDDPMWGLFVLRHARAVNLYHQVFVLFIDKSSNPQYCKAPLYKVLDGIPVCYHFYRQSSAPVLGRLINTLRMLMAWRTAWRTAVSDWGQPDLMHVHILTRMGLFAWIIHRCKKIPYVITEHWSRYLPQNFFYTGMLRKYFTGIVVNEASAIMPVTQNLTDAMQHLNLKNDHWCVVPNAVDSDTYPVHSNVTLPLTVVHISTFDDRAKNISGILRVAKRLSDEGVSMALRIVGSGIDFIAMRDFASSLGLSEPFVRFEGEAVPEMIPEILASSHALLLFSNYENIPVVINEALSAGIPVIATRVGGIAEIVDSTNGFLIEPGDEEALYRTLKELIATGTSGFNAADLQNFAKSRFSFASVGQQISDVYTLAMKP